MSDEVSGKFWVLADNFAEPKLNDGAVHCILFVLFQGSDDVVNPGDSLICELIFDGSNLFEQLKALPVLFGLELFEPFFDEFGQHLAELEVAFAQIAKIIGECVNVKL
jgi:hypothetical protein